MDTPPPRNSLVPTVGGLPILCVLLALATCGLELWAWRVDDPFIAGLGRNSCWMPPLAAMCGVALAILVLGAMYGVSRRRLLPLMAMALAACIVDLLCAFDRLPLGLAALPFPASVLTHHHLHLNRPGAALPVVLTLLAIASYRASRHEQRASRQAVIVAGLALVMALIACTLLPFGIVAANAQSRHALISTPAAIAAIALSMALLTWQFRAGWPELPWNREIENRPLYAALAACVLSPTLFTLIRPWAVHIRMLTPELANILSVGAQTIILVGILFWAWSRINSENAARRELTRALDAAPIILTDMQGKILHWSKGCERLYQWSAREAVGRIKHQLLGVDIPGRWDAMIGRLRDGLVCEEEIIEQRKDGTSLFILEQTQLVDGVADRRPIIIFSMTDITERTRAEEALRASDDRLALAIEAHQIGIFEWERRGDLLNLSSIAEGLSRPPGGGLSGGLAQWIRHLRTTFDLELAAEDGSARIAHASRLALRMQPRHMDGRLHLVEGTLSLVRDGNGRVIRMTGVLFDASERERRTMALRARESELQSILETVPDAMITFDEQGLVQSFSIAAEQLSGYLAQEVIGKPIKQFIPIRRHGEHDLLFRRYLHHGEPYLVGLTQRMPIVHRDGTEIMVELAVGEARVGEQRLFIGFLRDLSERLAADARMAELRDELVHVSRLSAMGEMAAGLAHELNQPLAATTNFLGAADMALAADDDDHAREFVQLAAKQALRAGDIIKRVRGFVSRGKVEVREELLANLLSEAVDLILVRNGRQPVSVHFQLDPSQPKIMADRVQIQQVVVNLVRNAMEAAGDQPGHKPEILIQSRPAPAGMVEISVQDNGPGIAPEILSRWPEPFLSAKRDGMGIGLSICRRIIEAHGGVLRVSNKAESGAVVCFTVPAAAGEDGDRP